MKQYVVDTSAIYAFVYNGDKNHQRISQFIRDQAGKSQFLVSHYVFDEIMTLLKSHFGADKAIQTGRLLRSSRLFQLIPLTSEDEEETWNIFQRHVDKEWSYTDCASLALLHRLNLREAVAFDHHFQQMDLIVHPR